MEQQIKFCRTADGVRIAYAIAGQGPPLVKAPNWLTHLEFELQSPVWRHWWEELAQDFTVIRFDQRGTGLSDWDVPETSLEAWVSDLEAVVDATGLDQFALLGISQGAMAAVDYAARHTDKVTHLVTFGGFARGRLKRGMAPELVRAVSTLIAEGWGMDNPAYRQLFTSQFMPEGTPEQVSWFNELQRMSTSPENAARIYDASSQADVVDRLPQIGAPTLVLHAMHDERIPYDEAKLIASLIPHADLVGLDSRNHLTLADEPAWESLIANVRHFLQTGEPLPESETTQRKPAGNGSSTDGLTPREIDVLRLLAEGRSNQEIAAELVISINTVTNHVKNILAKTGTGNRTEAANYAHRHGLMPA
jgi:pimeloyl-ACP methyl ester carboxylesterase/DNA-binding CsgD family transcriptional regulator